MKTLALYTLIVSIIFILTGWITGAAILSIIGGLLLAPKASNLESVQRDTFLESPSPSPDQ